MKKLFLLSFILPLLALTKLYGQCAPDSTLTVPGIYPRNLPDAKEDSIYDEVIQFKMPKDTQTFLGKIKYDSIVIVSISGIPAKINYACNANPGFSACTWAGGSNGCLRVFGTPDSGTAGVHKCGLKLKAYVVLGGSVQFFETSDTLLFRVRSKYTPNGISLEPENDVYIYPNPASSKLYISGGSTISPQALVSLFDISGRLKATINWAEFQQSGFDIQFLTQGIYILRISEGTRTIHARFQR